MTLSNIPGPEVSAPSQNTVIAPSNGNGGDFPIPSYSGWFSFTQIHEIERRAFPEIFSETEIASPFFTPQIYREYRDFMIHTFRMRPAEYLTVTVCRRHLAGDVSMIMKIHAFLEQWGLINYQVTESSSLNGTGFITTTVQAHKATLPASLDAFLKSESGAVQLKCKGCEADCTALYYHAPAARYNLCVGCFTSGQYGGEMAAADFIKIDTGAFATTSSQSDWTDEETLKLLEAVEKYSDSGVNMAANNVWDAIAENVGRSREACLLQFLRLPVTELLQNSSMNTALPASLAAFPFSQSENPVLSVVAFLAGNVHPRVAAVASQAALSELSKLDTNATVNVSANANITATSSLTNQSQLDHVASVALASAAAHATNLAQAEEKRLQYWRDCLLETQLKKLQIKLDSLDELERIVEEDRKAVAEQRLQIFMERYNLRKMMLQYERKE